MAFGAGDGIRTRDIFLGKEVLYHWATPAKAKPVWAGEAAMSYFPMQLPT
jgi:hypothetical protein